jgi:hypothetical protein
MMKGVIITKRYLILIRAGSIRGECIRGEYPYEEWRMTHKTPNECLGEHLAPWFQQYEQSSLEEHSFGEKNRAFRVKHLEETCPPYNQWC